MSEKPKAIDPIPEEFPSYEAAAEFWDTHDTTDYLDVFETVPFKAELQQRRFEVQIDERGSNANFVSASLATRYWCQPISKQCT